VLTVATATSSLPQHEQPPVANVRLWAGVLLAPAAWTVAELLGYPQVNVVTHLEVGDGKVTAHREIEGAEEIIEASTPAVITAQKGLNEPRYAGLKGIMNAKKIAIDTKSVADLGLNESDILNQRVVFVSLQLPPEKAGGRKIDASDPAAAAQEIIKYIREEAKAL